MSEFAFKRKWGPSPKYDRVIEYQRQDNKFIVIAGPCSVETEDQINTISDIVASCGATHLRGGVFRAGTFPGDNFGWVDRELLKSFHEAAKRNGLQNIIELFDVRVTTYMSDYADCFQVGCRQMQNYMLLRMVAETGKTVFLKRNPGAKLDEWLGAAEYVLKYGGHPVLIERGSSTHTDHTRWDLSISMIPAVKAITEIPVIVDASHGTGRRDLVPPMTLAGVAAGADGCLVEVHTNPEKSLSDADQAISPDDFHSLMGKIKQVRKAIQTEVI